MSQRKTERLMNVLIALLVSRGYLDKARLRSLISDYAGASSDAAFERMFDRDKEDLRALGVPIETGSFDPLVETDEGYRVSREAFELPPIDLEADEVAVIGLAAQAWEQAGLAEATTDVVRKLRAAGVKVDLDGLRVARPASVPHEESFAVLHDAVAERRQVSFDYRTSRGPCAERRVVQPWGVVSYRSRWYLIGHDLGRDDTRMFRLSRATSHFTVGPADAFERPENVDLRALTDMLAPDVGSREARIRIQAGRGVGLRTRATAIEAAVDTAPSGDGWDLLTLTFGRLDTLVDEVVSLAEDAVVEAPDELRQAVIERLRESLAEESAHEPNRHE